MPLKEVYVTKKFEQNIKSVKDKSILKKLKTQIEKIRDEPETGKPLRHMLKGERTIYVKPYRLIYSVDDDTLILLRFMHRKKVYK